jgi:transposase InsO family protein
MQVKLHKNAKTTLAIRAYIKNSKESIYALAKKFNLNWTTVKRWKFSESLEDKSSRPHKLNTTLTKEQEELICFERKQFKKTIEDIYFTLEDKIPNLYPMKIYRCLKRHGLATLPDDFVKMERKIKKFKRYGIGYLHIDLLYAPKINKERRYIYTAIDRVSKIAFITLGKTKRKETAASFLKEVLKFYPYKINYILTDNGLEFSYKALPKGKKTKKTHPFDKICQEHKIQHRTIKFKHPWTNGMVENFNKRIKNKVLTKYRFKSIFDLNNKLLDFVDDYNQNKRLKSLNYKTPAQYLKETKGIILQRIVS